MSPTPNNKSGLRSMTGFGRGEADGEPGSVGVEIRSVNSRFADIKVNLPSMLLALEARARELLKGRIGRGKIDCRVSFTPGAADALGLQFNEPAILAYVDELKKLNAKAGLDAPVTIDMALRLPGATQVEDVSVDAEAVWPAMAEALGAALEAFEAERAREGGALAAHILEDLGVLRACRQRIEAAGSQVVEKFRERLALRIAELEENIKAKLEPGRLEVEVALFADRCDVSEEMARLGAHLDRLNDLARNPAGKPVGKALDFLIQEILREINTTGSKARDTTVVEDVLEMKNAIERIREQIQNIE